MTAPSPTAVPARHGYARILSDIGERCVRAFLVAFVAAVSAGGLGVVSVSTLRAGAVAGIAAVLSLLLSLLGATRGADSASLLPGKLDPAAPSTPPTTVVSGLTADATTALAQEIAQAVGPTVSRLLPAIANIVDEALLHRTPPIVTADHSDKRLGAVPSKPDPRTLSLAQYVSPTLAIPEAFDGYSHVPADAWGLQGNDVAGDCAEAAAVHMTVSWVTVATGKPPVIPDMTAVEAYEVITGYDPTRTLPDGSNPTDLGSQPLDVLNHWRKLGIGGKAIAAFTSVDPANIDEVKAAIMLTDGCYVALDLPLSARQQAVWDVVPGLASEPGSWGGHAVNAVGYDAEWVYVVTWGQILRMSWEFFSAYVMECWAVVSEDYLTTLGKTPDGFDLPTLIAHVGDLTGYTTVAPAPPAKSRRRAAPASA